MRTGLIAEKLGMSRILTEQGDHIPVTVLHVGNCQVVSHKTTEKHGYNALQLGIGTIKTSNVTRPLKGHFAANKVEPRRKLVEFPIDEKAFVEVGSQLSPAHFVVGQYVDIAGQTIGRGFAGAMKRHNFGGLRASHGVSISHRSHGSTGNRQDPGKVFKNKKMAGHMGCVRMTQQNLKVVAVDEEKGLLLIQGSVPGSEGSYVYVCDAVKRPLPAEAPFPAAVRQIQMAEKAE